MEKFTAFIRYWLKFMPVFFGIGFLYTDIAFANEFSKAWNGLYGEVEIITAGVAGIGALTSLLIFIFHMIKLASEGSHNSKLRAKILHDIVISGICTGLLGGIGLVYILIYQSVWFG